MPANKTSFYKNGLTKLEVYEIKENIKALESHLFVVTNSPKLLYFL
jgi:hypothetical protein